MPARTLRVRQRKFFKGQFIMKIKRFIESFLSIIILLICFCAPAWSISDDEIIQGLETLGDLEAAYSLAYEIAKQQNTYERWRDIAIKYAQFDTDNKAYLQAWQQTYKLNQEAIYRDFLTIKPQSPFNRYAIHALFKLIKSSDNLEKYQQFLAEFPDVIESIEAVLKMHEIAFQRAKEINAPLVFDAFVTTFYGAKQIPMAIEQAFKAEKLTIEKTVSQTKNYEEREYIARRLFNQARIAEKPDNSLLAARKYRLLNLEIFIETQVFTELLDREERLAYQKLMADKQAEIAKSIQEMREAIVETIQVQTQHLENTVVNELQRQGQSLEEIIAEQNRLLTEKLDTVNKNLQQGYLAGVGADMADLVPIVGTGLKIAKVIGRISPAIARALSKPNKQQAVLLFAKPTDSND